MRRAKVRLTDLTIRNLKPRGARRQVQDADIPGFGVLVTATVGDAARPLPTQPRGCVAARAGARQQLQCQGRL
jgi:hypothetical protein